MSLSASYAAQVVHVDPWAQLACGAFWTSSLARAHLGLLLWALDLAFSAAVPML
jgi:hypothetical protein